MKFVSNFLYFLEKSSVIPTAFLVLYK